MSILLMNLFVVYIGSFLSRINIKTNKLETDYKKYNYICLFIVISSLILISGFRYGSGTDYGTYSYMYSNTPNIIISETSEFGYEILNKILFNISPNPQIFFFTTSMIINILIVWGICKYSRKFELSMYLYITTYIYYSTFNGIRQWIASAIIFIAFKHLLNRDFKKYIIYVLIAFLFHNSALVMIPMYFIANRRFLSKKTLGIIILFISMYVFYNGFLGMLFDLLQNTKYAHYEQGMQDWQESASLIRVVVYAIPLIIISIFYEKVEKYEDENIDIIMNLCLMSVLFMLLANKHVFFARMNLFFDIYYVLLIPKLTQFKDKKLNKFMYYSIAICYFAYSYKLLLWGDSRILPYAINMNLF